MIFIYCFLLNPHILDFTSGYILIFFFGNHNKKLTGLHAYANGFPGDPCKLAENGERECALGHGIQSFLGCIGKRVRPTNLQFSAFNAENIVARVPPSAFVGKICGGKSGWWKSFYNARVGESRKKMIDNCNIPPDLTARPYLSPHRTQRAITLYNRGCLNLTFRRRSCHVVKADEWNVPRPFSTRIARRELRGKNVTNIRYVTWQKDR